MQGLQNSGNHLDDDDELTPDGDEFERIQNTTDQLQNVS